MSGNLHLCPGVMELWSYEEKSLKTFEHLQFRLSTNSRSNSSNQKV